MVHRRKQKVAACFSNTEKLLCSRNHNILLLSFVFLKKKKKKEERSSILERQVAVKFQITACNRIFDTGPKILKVSLSHYM